MRYASGDNNRNSRLFSSRGQSLPSTQYAQPQNNPSRRIISPVWTPGSMEYRYIETRDRDNQYRVGTWALLLCTVTLSRHAGLSSSRRGVGSIHTHVDFIFFNLFYSPNIWSFHDSNRWVQRSDCEEDAESLKFNQVN